MTIINTTDNFKSLSDYAPALRETSVRQVTQLFAPHDKEIDKALETLKDARYIR